MEKLIKENGFTGTGKIYDVVGNTIKKWCKRYAAYGLKGLIDKSRKPKNSSKRINQEDIDKICEVSKNAKEKKKQHH